MKSILSALILSVVLVAAPVSPAASDFVEAEYSSAPEDCALVVDGIESLQANVVTQTNCCLENEPGFIVECKFGRVDKLILVDPTSPGGKPIPNEFFKLDAITIL